MSNDIAAIRHFLADREHSISKTIVCDYPHSIPTRQCTLEDFASSRDVAPSPIIVQERADAILDIRVTVVDGQVFAAELERSDIN